MDFDFELSLDPIEFDELWCCFNNCLLLVYCRKDHFNSWKPCISLASCWVPSSWDIASNFEGNSPPQHNTSPQCLQTVPCFGELLSAGNLPSAAWYITSTQGPWVPLWLGFSCCLTLFGYKSKQYHVLVILTRFMHGDMLRSGVDLVFFC